MENIEDKSSADALNEGSQLVEVQQAATATQKKEKNPCGPGWFAIFVLCLIVSVASATASVYVYDQYYAQKFVAIDIKGYMADIRDQYVAKKIDDEGVKLALKKLGVALDSIPKNKAIVMGDAVVRNVEVVKP
jgi:hypothetical protein